MPSSTGFASMAQDNSSKEPEISFPAIHPDKETRFSGCFRVNGSFASRIRFPYIYVRIIAGMEFLSMNDRLIFEIIVDIDAAHISQLNSTAGEVVMIPFSGTATGEFFQGLILPGGVDVQTVDQTGVRHMSARYMLEGTDKTGQPCRIYVDNNGWFSGEMVMPFRTIPTFRTDSRSLAEYLHRNKFRAEGHPREGGVIIKVFEICS